MSAHRILSGILLRRGSSPVCLLVVLVRLHRCEGRRAANELVRLRQLGGGEGRTKATLVLFAGVLDLLVGGTLGSALLESGHTSLESSWSNQPIVFVLSR